MRTEIPIIPIVTYLIAIGLVVWGICYVATSENRARTAIKTRYVHQLEKTIALDNRTERIREFDKLMFKPFSGYINVFYRENVGLVLYEKAEKTYKEDRISEIAENIKALSECKLEDVPEYVGNILNIRGALDFISKEQKSLMQKRLTEYYIKTIGSLRFKIAKEQKNWLSAEDEYWALVVEALKLGLSPEDIDISVKDMSLIDSAVLNKYLDKESPGFIRSARKLFSDSVD